MRADKKKTNSYMMSEQEILHRGCIDMIEQAAGKVTNAHNVLHSGLSAPNCFGIVYDSAEALLDASVQLVYLSDASDEQTRQRADAAATRVNKSAMKYTKMLDALRDKRGKYSTEQLLPALVLITEKLVPIAAELGREAAPWLGEFVFYPDADGDNDAHTCTLAEMNQLTDMQVDGSNISVDLGFGTEADADWHLNATSPASVKFGGIDFSIDFSIDKDGAQRTTPWSIGAYEQNLI